MRLMQKIQMASEDVKSYLHTGVFYDNDVQAPVADGACVVVGDLEDHDTYKNMKDINARKITAPKAQTDKVSIVDYVGVSQGEIMGVLYREGSKTAGLGAVAGERVRVRDLKPIDEFWLSTGCFSGTPEVGKYAVPTANDTLWTVVDAPVEGAVNLKIETTKTLITGMVNDSDMLFYCTVQA